MFRTHPAVAGSPDVFPLQVDFESLPTLSLLVDEVYEALQILSRFDFNFQLGPWRGLLGASNFTFRRFLNLANLKLFRLGSRVLDQLVLVEDNLLVLVPVLSH